MATNFPEDTRLQATQPEASAQSETMIIPVIQEEITVDKRVIETGKVRVSKRISEREELIDVPLLREEVTIERVPMNLFVESHPPVRQEGDIMIIPVVEEQVVMQKKLVLVEELRVHKQIVQTHQPQTVTLLKEEVEIRRSAGNENLNRQSVD